MEFAVLKSGNEANWSDHGEGYMSRFSGRAVFWQDYGQLPATAPPPTAAAFNAVPAKSYSHRYVTFRLGSYTRRELKELKYLLISDLQRVRALRRRISSPPEVAPKQCYQESRPLQPGQEFQPPVVAPVVKKSEKFAGQKRTMPFSSAARETKKQCGAGGGGRGGGGDAGGMKINAQKNKVLLLKKCGQILTKLMMHKYGWVFNKPVNPVALGLHDYSTVIKTPMDLGTIKAKLEKNMYNSPLAFASDVRLTFQNAMTYNGNGSDVYAMANGLLSLFESLFASAKESLKSDQAVKCKRSTKVPAAVGNPVTNVAKKSNPMARKTAVTGTVKAANSGKPMARNVIKREMTREDKSELAMSLMNLQMGPEGMDQIMEIIKNRVSGLTPEDDEIELDIEVLDNETLWELHSFVVSSRKKAAENAKTNEGVITNLVSPVRADNFQVNEHPQGEQGKKKDGVEEEEIDIGEDTPVTNFPSVWIEKDAVNISSSSSSSSSSSGSDTSSSDSDSGTSSGNGSDEEEAH